MHYFKYLDYAFFSKRPGQIRDLTWSWLHTLNAPTTSLQEKSTQLSNYRPSSSFVCLRKHAIWNKRWNGNDKLQSLVPPAYWTKSGDMIVSQTTFWVNRVQIQNGPPHFPDRIYIYIYSSFITADSPTGWVPPEPWRMEKTVSERGERKKRFTEFTTNDSSSILFLNLFVYPSGSSIDRNY